MSAINDALRRASGAANGAEPGALPVGDSAAALPPPLPGMSLAGDNSLPPLLQPPAEKRSFPWLLIVVLFLFCTGAGAGYYWWTQRNRVSFVAQKPTRPAPAPATAQKPSPTPIVSAPEKSIAPVAAPAPATSVPEKSAVVATVPPPRPPVQFPQLRLQGIYFKPSNPSVMINNRTLYLNDQIQGVTVAAIDASSVTLVLSGQTNILTLR